MLGLINPPLSNIVYLVIFPILGGYYHYTRVRGAVVATTYPMFYPKHGSPNFYMKKVMLKFLSHFGIPMLFIMVSMSLS